MKIRLIEKCWEFFGEELSHMNKAINVTAKNALKKMFMKNDPIYVEKYAAE